MSGLSRTPGKRVYGESRTEGSNPSLSASKQNAPLSGAFLFTDRGCVDKPAGSTIEGPGDVRWDARAFCARAVLSRLAVKDDEIALRQDRHNPSLSVIWNQLTAISARQPYATSLTASAFERRFRVARAIRAGFAATTNCSPEASRIFVRLRSSGLPSFDRVR